MAHDLVRIECPHRSNPDGTLDSICPRCYATIGTSTWEYELERLEAEHVCNNIQLKFFDSLKKKAIASPKKPVTSVHPAFAAPHRLAQVRG